MLITEETMQEQTVADGLPVPPLSTLVGALPNQEMFDQTTSQHSVCCEGCGRPPGPVAALGTPLFDLGMKHALNELVELIAAVPGVSRGEAKAIVLKLEKRAVAL